MASHEDASLILKLYELRREEKLRAAREWFTTSFRPQSAQDVMDTFAGENGVYLRMVGSYWDMAAAMVNHGTIDLDMFCDTSGEGFLVYAAVEPFIPELRAKFGNDRFFGNLEKVVQKSPAAQQMVAWFQARWKAEAERLQQTAGA
jgi:hypothetical protein